MFIALEGPDGGGKTTQAAILAGRLERVGKTVVSVHEPGGTLLGAELRAILVRRAGPPLKPWAEALLFSACRAQLVAEVIRPALLDGYMVVADRYADSTRAYQGSGRGLPRDRLEQLIEIASGGLQPDLKLLLDLPAPDGLARLGSERADVERMPQEQLTFLEELQLPSGWNGFDELMGSFHERVRDAYRTLAAEDPLRWVVIDASQPIEEVADAIWTEVTRRLEAGIASGVDRSG